MEASLTVTPVADRKFGKFYTQVFEPASEAAGFTDERFQLLLEQEKDLQVRTRVEQFLRELNGQVMESETVSVDYDEANATIAAFEANKFGSKWVDLDLATIQVGGSGKVDHKVFEWHPNRVVYNREIWPHDKLKKVKPGYKFADFLTALKYALKVPDRQLDHPLVILFEHNGRLCYLYLRRDGVERRVGVNRTSLGGSWRGGCRFLLVRE